MNLPYASMLNQMSEAIVYADEHGVIRLWNPAAVTMFGFTEQEAVGQSLDIMIPEYLREAHWRGFHAALAAGKTKHGGKAVRTKALHQSGEFIYAEVSFCVVEDAVTGQRGSLACARAIEKK